MSDVISSRRNTCSSPLFTLVADTNSCTSLQPRTASKSTKRSMRSFSGLMLSGLKSYGDRYLDSAFIHRPIGVSSIGQNENRRSTARRCTSGRLPPMLAARQNSARRLRASFGPPRASPSASMIALTAPADAPEMPSIVSRPSSSRWSSTPQVNAPSAPPPCKARLMRLPAFGFSGVSPPKARERNSIIVKVSRRHAQVAAAGGPRKMIVCRSSLRDPAAVDRIGRTGDSCRTVAAQEHGKRADAFRFGELMHRLLLRQQRDFLVVHAFAGSFRPCVDLLLHQRCKHPTWADRIASHACVGGFHCDHLGETDEAVLRRHIGDLLRAGHQP